MKNKIILILLICSLIFNITFILKHPFFRLGHRHKRNFIEKHIDKQKRQKLHLCEEMYHNKRLIFIKNLSKKEISKTFLDSLEKDLIETNKILETTSIQNLRILREKLGYEKFKELTKNFKPKKRHRRKK